MTNPKGHTFREDMIRLLKLGIPTSFSLADAAALEASLKRDVKAAYDWVCSAKACLTLIELEVRDGDVSTGSIQTAQGQLDLVLAMLGQLADLHEPAVSDPVLARYAPPSYPGWLGAPATEVAVGEAMEAREALVEALDALTRQLAEDDTQDTSQLNDDIVVAANRLVTLLGQEPAKEADFQ